MSNNNPSSSGNSNNPLVWQSDVAGNAHQGVRIMPARALFEADFKRPFADEQDPVQTSESTQAWDWQPTSTNNGASTPSGPPVLLHKFQTTPIDFSKARSDSVVAISPRDLPGNSGYQPGPSAPSLQPMQLEPSNGQARTDSGCSRCVVTCNCSFRPS